MGSVSVYIDSGHAVIGLGLIILAWIAKLYLPSYLRKTSENLATKEDLHKIVRYEHEFTILLELSGKIVNVRDAAMGLKTEAGYGDIDDPEEKKRSASAYLDAGRQFYLFIESRLPFFTEDIYSFLKAFESKTWTEFVHFKHQDPNSSAFWDHALKNGAEIGTMASTALVLIRQRVQVWEKFDAT